MFGRLGEKTLYIFAACNILTIPIIWALYPETNQRTLEEIDLLFSSDSLWTWDAEKNFAKLKRENAHAALPIASDSGSDEKKDIEQGNGMSHVE